jgi:hypothetical protein
VALPPPSHTATNKASDTHIIHWQIIMRNNLLQIALTGVIHIWGVATFTPLALLEPVPNMGAMGKSSRSRISISVT